ncbi:MAG: glycoside hydrolase family 15 protein [Thermodesulfobacteriota bacterium]
MYKRINDYGIIGNLGSSAIVGIDGSIDWACLPHLDSPAFFFAILDDNKGGLFQIAPAEKYGSVQSYEKHTAVLDTTFTTDSGEVLLRDFMPLSTPSGDGEGFESPVIYRVIAGLRGEVEMNVLFRPRLDFGREDTSIEVGTNGVRASGNKDFITLSTVVPFTVAHGEAAASVVVREGEGLVFLLAFNEEFERAVGVDTVHDSTLQAWRNWAHKCGEAPCVYGGPWHNMVVRSAITLKLLTHSHTGSVAAAATASLPEAIGGERNWDYRFAWLRDATFTVQALNTLGHTKEAMSFLSWFQGVVSRHKDPSEIQVMYGLHGERELNELELLHLDGYKGSRPVRIGNEAVGQRQLDVYGEVLDAVYQLTRYGGLLESGQWPFIRSLADYVATAWQNKDAGIWEIRGGTRHFVYSKVMCWVALDRAVKLCDCLGHTEDKARWRAEADAIKERVLAEGYSEKTGAFVQSFGSEDLDASNLLIPLVGFLPFTDPRVQSTIEATIKGLGNGVFVHRYKGDDGLSGGEGAFLLCSFWLVDCLTLSGRVDEAREMFEKLMGLSNHLGLFSEEIDAETGDFLGNFPQAFTHIGFINSALYLGKAQGLQQMGPEPMGMER